MKIGFIGGGNMAQALIGGLQAELRGDATFVVVEPHEPTRKTLLRRFGSATLHDAPSVALSACDAIVIAVKPQTVKEAIGATAPWLVGQPVVSIAAGVRTAEIARWLGDAGTAPHVPIVRAMPNTPALIGEGIAGLYAAPSVAPAHRTLAERLLSAVGQTLWVDDEATLDAVTAVSGSGPAYVFAFIEALQHGGREVGLSPADARRLAVATFVGASRLAADSVEPVEILRERVTSKGGTTQAGLETLAAAGCHDAIVEAVRAAASRSVEIGDEFSDEFGNEVGDEPGAE